MTATKIQPGDDLHLTSLMSPHSLNFVTGADRAALLAYGRDVFAAARNSKCLAQIEEPAAPAAVAPRGEYPHEQMDAMALARYKVVPSHASMLWSHAVVAGDGAQQLYVGREVECQNMARKFAGAFLDGAFAFHSMAAAPTAQAAPALEAPAAPVTLMTEDQASRWAWDQIREEVGTKGWTAGDSSNFFGFFLHGWNYRGQYELQRPAALLARAALAAAPQAPAAPAEAQRLAQFLQRMRTHLGSCRESAGTYNQQAWDDYERAWTMLLGMAAPAAPAVDASDDTALLDAMQRHRIALVPEFEGPWDAEIFNDEAEAHPIASGNTPREALRAALAAQAAAKGEHDHG
ncbi:hypothetical protein Daci_1911 [Delftia acidovorans SPH-1]|uniref:Uncharacterized protein n=1 Tax=Delftia acidovorans (strain DSM 14801 / SPH-1) TaxID=398578 RepID=A9BYK8_DELAS|nr:hypothetical protein [Delftia acidovorans]ABX34551.1 hypothetical protein Daci_1911 [Delftia acidovorans SPH-1]QPS76085.1 hypothetical protein I6G48_05885 [Delftia acidovorans]